MNRMRSRLQCLLRAAAIAPLVVAAARAQDDAARLSGNLAADLRMLAHDTSAYVVGRGFRLDGDTLAAAAHAPHKSVPLAGALSAVLPGTGQVYAEAPLWRTILYGGIEAAGWTLYAVYSAKNVSATNDFQNFADAHWDVTRYVEWISANYRQWSSQSGAEVDVQAASEALAGIYRSHDPGLAPWDRIDFAQLNKLERAIKGGFSHTLPAHGDQQYYEELGKYFQYRAGWDDHPASGDTLLFDPSRVTQRNHDYVAQREEANGFGSYAMTAVGVVVLNHLVSLIDAALAARGYNIAVDAGLHGGVLPDGRHYIEPTVAVLVRF